jgi:hypothetical protein
MKIPMTNGRTCLLWAGKMVLLLAILGCNSETTISGTTNWVRCDTDTECETYAGAYCSGEGYCLDEEGERIEVESSVTLRAVVSETSPGGPQGIAAEWTNGTDEPIFLRGCMTVDGWYREGSEWLEYGALAQCAAETLAVEVAPGATYLDVSVLPPDRGDNVWRLVGPYGVDCTPGETFSEAGCSSTFELTSVNEVSP